LNVHFERRIFRQIPYPLLNQQLLEALSIREQDGRQERLEEDRVEAVILVRIEQIGQERTDVGLVDGAVVRS